MKRTARISIIAAAAFLLAAGFAFTVFAKGWVHEGEGLFYYLDEYDMKVCNAWAKDLGKYYYLGEDGYMVTNTLVPYNGEFYYCGPDGAKITDAWQKIDVDTNDQPDLGVEYRWYYFDSKGQAVRNAKKVLNELTYWFDGDGKMLFGYVNTTDHIMTTSVDEAFSQGSKYNAYCGTNDDGYQRKNEWFKLTLDHSSAASEDMDYFWAFYNSTGERATSEMENGILWNGQRYFFDENGHMKYGWTLTNGNVEEEIAPSASYYGGPDDGKMVKKAWAYVTPQSGGETKYWFYFDSNGSSVSETCVRRINGKYYAFGTPKKNSTRAYYLDSASRMLSGMVLCWFDRNESILDTHFAAKLDDFLSEVQLFDGIAKGTVKEKWTVKDWTAYPYFDDVYYFSDDEENDGSLHRSVTFSQEFRDDTCNLTVDKTGKLANGLMGKKYYVNGLMMKAAEDVRYEVKTVWLPDDNYPDEGHDFPWYPRYALLSASGSEVTRGVASDADGSYYVVKYDSATMESTIYKASSAELCPAQMAANFNKTAGDESAEFKYDGTWYRVSSDKSCLEEKGFARLELEKIIK